MSTPTGLRDVLPALAILVVLGLLAASGAGITGWSLAGASALLAWASLVTRRRAPRPTALALPPPWQRLEWVMLAILAFLVLVLVPLPLSFTGLTGGARFTQNTVAATRLRQATALDAIQLPPLWFSITRNRAGSLRVLAICIGAFSATLLARRLPPVGRRFLLRALVVGGALIAAAGIVSLYVIPQKATLWWFITIPHSVPASAACFVNQNHFGGFAAMLCPAAILLAADDIHRRRWFGVLLMSLAAVILAAAVPLSESRGGVVAGACALVIIPLFLFSSGHRRVALWMTLPMLVVLTTLALVVLPRVDDSMRSILKPTQTASLQGRIQVWQESLTIWRHHPVLGAGPNSFHTAYPMYRRSSVSGHRTHAENLYAETLADTGTVGTGLALWAAVAVVSGIWLAWKRRECDPILTFSVAAAIVVTGVHALVDFATYVPLYSLTLGAIVGLALPPAPSHRPGIAGMAAAVLALLVCIFAPAMGARDSIYTIQKAKPDALARSIVWAPTSQHAWFYAGKRLGRSKRKPVRLLGERFMAQSMVYDPKNYRHWRKLGELRLKLGDRDGAREAYEAAHALRAWVGVPAHLKETP
ncbi:MAG: O-antigen ligase family protein [Verrucomicrobia bacterium]|jgi:O-antigen ligase|nr:O-antigen ligase family protein [Verrucomicrobiota bacterium]MBT7068159.1 O-antigen ligase family protein [Verrucomicrobiota bacterium]